MALPVARPAAALGFSAAAESPLRRALSACKQHLRAVAVFSALLNLLMLAPTLYMLQVYDRVVSTGGKLTLLFITLALLAALLTMAALDGIRGRLLVRANLRLERELSPVVLDAALSPARRVGPGVRQQALRQFDTLRGGLTGQAVLALLDAPWTPIYIAVAALLHPWLGALGLLGVVILGTLTFLNERAMKAPLQRANESLGAAYSSQEHSLGHSDVVRALGMRRAMVARHQHERSRAVTEQGQASFSGGGYSMLTRFARQAFQSLSLGLAAYLAINQEISAGGIFAASLLIGRALAPIEQLTGSWRTAVQARAAWRLLNALFDDAGEARTPTQLPAPKGALRVEQLVVPRPGGEGLILKGVGFEMQAGEVVAVLGPSGAGKSTLVKAVAGAAQIARGDIRFDGAELNDWDMERLAKHLGYLPQEVALFGGTIRDNISRFEAALGGDPATIDAKVVEAAVAAGAHDVILRLPQGYDTRLDMGGRGLSAGQAQRVALARALYGEPALLILDEPNAHLDNEGEAHLIEALKRHKAQGRSALVVAHRLGVLTAADKVLVLRDGAVEMFGPPSELQSRAAAAAAGRGGPPQPGPGGPAAPPQPQTAPTSTFTSLTRGGMGGRR